MLPSDILLHSEVVLLYIVLILACCSKVCSSRNTLSKRNFPQPKAGCAAFSGQEPAGELDKMAVSFLLCNFYLFLFLFNLFSP